MRLRRKKNLEEKVEGVSVNLLARDGDAFFRHSDKDTAFKIDIKKVFPTGKINLEIGCGKGTFCSEMAKKYPEQNFIGVEKLTNVLYSALEKNVDEVANLKYINCDAQNLSYFLPEACISKIYLNFSCPFPKHTYANRRLTNKKFLKIYEIIGDESLTIEQKTDSDGLWEYSLSEYEENGWEIIDKCWDIYSDESYLSKREIQTEFEQKFVSLGKPIHYICAKRKLKNS